MNQDIDQSMSEVMLDVAAMMDVIVADPALTSLEKRNKLDWLRASVWAFKLLYDHQLMSPRHHCTAAPILS